MTILSLIGEIDGVTTIPGLPSILKFCIMPNPTQRLFKIMIVRELMFMSDLKREKGRKK